MRYFQLVNYILYGHPYQANGKCDSLTQTFVAIGSSELPNCTRGYVATPLTRIERALVRRAKEGGKYTVILVDEFNTNKTCSACHHFDTVSKSPERYTFCQKCNVTFNTDINASLPTHY